MIIVWLKAILGSSVVTPCIYKLFKKDSEHDTFAAWFFRGGNMLWIIITIALVCWLAPRGTGWGDGSDY